MNIEENTKDHHFFRTLFFLILLFIILLILYSRYLGTSSLFVKEYNIIDSSLPSSFSTLKIAHFSDIHFGRTTDIKDIKELVNRINDKKVDIIIFTGDLFDKSYKPSETDIKNIKEEFNKLNANYGKYYVNGEDDLKTSNFENIMEESSFVSLLDKNEEIISKKNERIIVSGISYKNDNIDFLNEISNYSYKILLLHKPDEIDDLTAYNFNIALAGHSHNNQINIPYIKTLYSKNGARKYYNPYYKVDNTDLYISSGIGTSDYSFRFLNRPSFNLYKIKNN